jgi:hypothetical protein
MPPTKYRDEDEIKEVVRKFEACEYGLAEFPHARHLAVAAFYLASLSADEAMVRMRVGLSRFIEHHSRQGYHETITRFWMLLVDDFLEKADPGATLVQSVNELISHYADKNILFTYYTREQIACDEAKTRWVDPDLKALP